MDFLFNYLKTTYVKDGIVPILLLLLRVLDPSCQIVDQDKLQEGGVNEEHADTVPEVHGCQAGHHRELRAESEQGSHVVRSISEVRSKTNIKKVVTFFSLKF